MSGDADAAGDGATGEEGRYCYCLVRVDDAAPTLDAVGVEETPVHVVTAGEVGAVVHPRAEPYDSDDPVKVRRWLLAHQRVVDAAGEAFGTPLPFRFDTVIDGDDGAVRGWLREERAAIDDALADLAGHWEYRVGVVTDAEAVEAHLLETDDELADLHETATGGEGGTGFLRQRQYEGRLREARRGFHADLTERVLAAAEDTVREAREQERRPGIGSGAGEAASAGGEDGSGAAEEGEEPTRVAQVAVLATEAAADAFGERLDDVAAEPGVEIRYTGPWPPYSFAPSFGEDA